MPNQVGVGYANGADVAVQCVRAFARDAVSPAAAGRRKVVITIDIKNAFNSIDRGAMIDSIRERLPDLLNYFLGAYSQPSLLSFGNKFVSSSTGTQQGDPTGPVGYSLMQSEKVFKAPAVAEAMNELDIMPTYLDDLTIGGDYDKVMAAFAAFELQGATVGLKVNRTKTVLFATPEVLALLPAAGPADIPRKPLDELIVLGVPCSPLEPAVDRLLRPAFGKWQTLLNMLTQLPQRHIALAMLRYCASDCKVMHLMRGLGPFRFRRVVGSPVADVWSECDEMIGDCLRAIVGGAVPGRSFEQAVSPCRYGGLGIRQIAPHAAVAHTTAVRRAIELHFSTVSTINLVDSLRDHAAAVINADPHLALHPPVRDTVLDTLRRGPAEITPRDFQRTASDGIELRRFQARFTSIPVADRRARAHAAATTAKYSSLWLYSSVFAGAPKLWFDDPVFYTAIRLRLGIELGVKEDQRCTFCQFAKLCDPLGDHSLTCSHGGNKTLVHNSVVDQVMVLATKAGAQPAREAHPFAGRDANARLDVVIRMPRSRDRSELCDVAVVHPCAQTYLAHDYCFLPAGKGGVADAYEKVKHARYAAAVAVTPTCR